MATLGVALRGMVQRAKQRGQAAAGGEARLEIILLLGAVLGLDAADKAAVSAVAGALEQTFGIGNIGIGTLIASVSFVGALSTLPIGGLVDRSNRRRILVITIAVWTLAMVIGGAATSFTFLLITRLFLGAVTAAATPCVASLVGDFFPPEARARTYGMILAGELIGIGVGFVIAGEVSNLLGWRWAFFFMGLPGAATGAVIWRHLPEPARGGQSWIALGQKDLSGARSSDKHAHGDRQDAARPARPREQVRRADIEPRPELILNEDPSALGLWRAMRYLLRIPTYRLVVIASILGYFFFAGVRAFAMIYLTQHYHLAKDIASLMAIVVGVGAVTGVVTGGWCAEWLLARGRIDARIIVPGVAFFAAAIIVIPAIWTTNAILGTALLTCGAGLLAAANPSLDAARLDITPAGLWGREESGRMALRGVSEGIAPILFGAMSIWLGGGAAGLRWTFLIMLMPVFVAALLAIPARRTYPRDVATADASMQNIRGRARKDST